MVNKTKRRTKKKSIEETYKTLTPVEHVLLRSGMYVGSTVDAEHASWFIKGENFAKGTEVVNPALIKIFDEIVSNAVDEHKRSNGNLNMIKVDIDRKTGEMVVWDNGGIPVVIHKESKLYVPQMIFSQLRTGSNFDDTDEREGAGTNGVGSTLTNIFSTKFKITTCDGKKRFIQNFTHNMSKSDSPKITRSTVNHTELRFTPDYERLDTSLHDGNFKEIERRVYAIAGCNPGIKVYFNGELIKIKSFKDYITMYTDNFVYTDNEKWKVGISSSKTGFEHISFVNGSETRDATSSHITYILDQVVVKLREYFKRKHKVDVKPSDIKSHITLFIDAIVINPKYHSQTKEKLITDPKNFQTSLTISDKFITQVLKSDIIDRILDWVEAKKLAAERAKMKKMNKPKAGRVEGYIPPIKTHEYLVLCEGKSAVGGISGALSRNNFGFFPLRGNPLNAWEATITKVTANKEYESVVTIGDIDISNPEVNDMKYDNILIATDMDLDGIGIRGSLISFFMRFTPNLVKAGRVKYLRTPLIIAFKNNKILDYFFTLGEYHAYDSKTNTKGIQYKYYKGLGTHDDKSLKEVFSIGIENFIETVEWDEGCEEIIDDWMSKDKRAKRKEYLEGKSFDLEKL
jgi:DNA topoisomerase-2